MNGKDISIIRKKYFAHPVLLNSKIEADDGVDFTISLKYAGIDWIFFSKTKFIAFITKYDRQHKFKNPVKKNKSTAKKKSASKKKKAKRRR